ncbi:MAG: TolC family protein [Chlorobi bacterium]|nr:TolC family protein [Chlorobiota bacterium]
MKAIKTIYFYLFLFISLNINSQEILNQYLQTAATNNPDLKSKFSEYMAAMEKIPQVGALPDPQLAFGYFISPAETRVGPQQFSTSISQVFPWFGLLNSKENVVSEIAKAKLEVFEDAKSQLFYNVKSAYYNLYFIDKGIGITKENIDILNTFQQLANIKFESGKASAVDELRVEIDIADLENQLAYLQDSRYAMQVLFNNLLNTDKNELVIIPDTLWNESLLYERDAILDSIKLQNHSIKQIEHRILSWEHQEEVANKSGMPDFKIGMAYTAVGKSSNSALSASENGKDIILLPQVGITIPLYRKKYNSMVKEASYKMEANKFKKTNRVNQLSTLFEQGFKDYRDGQRRIILYDKQLYLSKKSLDILLAEYSTNSKNFEEVLRMERKVLKYELELDKARADKNAAIAFINYLLGN